MSAENPLLDAARTAVKPTWVAALLATRPKTLTASLTPVATAAALLSAQGVAVSSWLILMAAVSALLIQIGTNLANDALDFRKGADTAERLGPARATQAGWLRDSQVLTLAHVAFALAVLAGIPLMIQGGWVIALIGAASIACGYWYTAGPYSIAYTGLGDLFVLLFFGLFAVGGVVFLHTGDVNGEAVLAGLQVGALSAVLLAVNNLRDLEEDRRSGKRTLPVRFGAGFGRLEVLALVTLNFGLQLLWWHSYQSPAMLLPFAALPIGVHLVGEIYRHEPSAYYNRLLAEAALLHLVFGLALIVALLLQT